MDTLFKFEYPASFLSVLGNENAHFVRNFVNDLQPSLVLPNMLERATELESFLSHPLHTEASKYHLWCTTAYIRLSENCKGNTTGRFYFSDSMKALFASEIPEDNESKIQYLYRCSFICAYMRNLETPYGIFRLHTDDFSNVIQPWFVKNAAALDLFHRTFIPRREVLGIARSDQEKNNPWDDGLPLCWWGMYGIIWCLGILLHEEDVMRESFEPLTRTLSEIINEDEELDYYGWQLFFFAGSGLDVWQQRTGINLPVIPKKDGNAVKVHIQPLEAYLRNWKRSNTGFK